MIGKIENYFHLVPFIGIVGYLNYPKQLKINNKLLYYISILHNNLLIIFSFYIFVSLLDIFISSRVIFKNNYYFSNITFDRLIYYFYLSMII